MTTVVCQEQPLGSKQSSLSTEQLAEVLRESMQLSSEPEDGDITDYSAERCRSSSGKRINGPPMEIVIITPPSSPHSTDEPPPPPPPPLPSKYSRSRRNNGKVEAVRPNEANKVLGFTNRGKTAVAKLFTKIPVVSAQGAANILSKRMRNAKAKEQQQQQEKPTPKGQPFLAKAANFLAHAGKSVTKEDKKSKPKTTNNKPTSSSKTPIPIAPPVIIPAISPQQLLDRIHMARGYSMQNYSSLECAYHSKPTELQQASYGTRVVEAVRQCDSDLLRRLLQAGLSPNPCNAYGESLLHMVSRRGDLPLLKEMIQAGCSFQVTDDFGRTPLHDACWTTTPRFDLIAEILNADIRLFRILDCRGASPLSYINKDNWVQWIQFFHGTINKYWPPRDRELKGEEQPPPLALLPPNARPIPDPPNALPIDVATMVSNGRRDPADLVREQQPPPLQLEKVVVVGKADDDGVTLDEYPEAESDDDSDVDSISTSSSASSTYSSSSSSSSQYD